MQIQNYLFPFDKVAKGSNIILYAAGNVGKHFYKQVITSGYCNILLWVDANANELKSKFDMPISAIGDIRSVAFDYCVIAIENEKIALEVAENLSHNYDIEKEKIVTDVYAIPQNRLYANQMQEYEYRYKNSDELMKIAPIELVKSNHLNLMVRYLVCRDIVNGVENSANLSLYSRFLLCASGANVGKGYFSENVKSNSKEFIAEIRKLCDSMRENGFDRAHYVPIAGENRILLNGNHRTAMALAQEQDIWCKEYPNLKGQEIGFQWFVDNGFNTNDQLRILRAFADLYPRCGMAVLYGPAFEQWSYIQSQLSKKLNVVGHVDIDFSHNYLGYENLIYQIYNDSLMRGGLIDLKISLLKMSPLKVRAILFSDEHDKGADIYEIAKSEKNRIRDAMFFDTDIAMLAIHSTDFYEEFLSLKQMLLSPNNILMLNKRISRNYRNELVTRIERFKQWLNENDIPHSDAVVVGSSIMEILGLRYAHDFDFTVKSKYRDRLGHGAKIIMEDFSLRKENLLVDEFGTVYFDDVIIDDYNLHFMFAGLKFMNYELLKIHKNKRKQEKDIQDIRFIELFEDYYTNYDDKAALRKQIDKAYHLNRL